jgi:glycosyltransferase involved in cell wall biosynthesis
MTQIQELKAENPRQRTEARDPNSEAAGHTARSSVADHRSCIPCHAATSAALLTGGNDRPYVLGLVPSLTSLGVTVDVIGSDDLELPELLSNSKVNFLNLRGDQRSDAALASKIVRVIRYYWRLLAYATTTKAKVFHVLWNNKFELLDRTLLMLYYKLMGRRLALTAHNVNVRKRDGKDSWLNRWSLRTQYQLSDHIFVHTEKMKRELVEDFRILEEKISVIPFGINNTAPKTDLTSRDAKRLLGIADTDKTVLCFGQIAPYKGLEYLVSAFARIVKEDGDHRLIIAGKPKWNEAYWKRIEQLMVEHGIRHRVIQRIQHVPDEETELYFKAADVLILSYTRVFQSGVIFLGYSFGLPAIVTDVGSLKEEIIEGRTGFVCKPKDSSDLAHKIDQYFKSELFLNLESRRAEIKAYANERYSWDKVAAITKAVYSKLLSFNR